MNWIDYSKRKPEVEPERQVLVRLGNGLFQLLLAGNWPSNSIITHWAEIEPPGERKQLKEVKITVGAEEDAFEDWWQGGGRDECGYAEFGIQTLKKAWNAAIRHAKRHYE